MTYREYMRKCAADYLVDLLERHRQCVASAALEAGCRRQDLYKVMRRFGVRAMRPANYGGNAVWRSLQ